MPHINMHIKIVSINQSVWHAICNGEKIKNQKFFTKI